MSYCPSNTPCNIYLLKSYMYLFGVSKHTMALGGGLEDNLQEAALSYQVGPGDQTRIVRLADKCPLSHLDSLIYTNLYCIRHYM